MNQMSDIKRSCICAICIATCYVLPLAFHAVGLGSAFSPMHLPVLLCGLLLGPAYGVVCGIIGPILSSLASGMPPFMMLLSMIPELCAYGLVTGLFMKLIHTGKLIPDLYISMISAMILGRIVGGIAKMLVVYFLMEGKKFTIMIWLADYFVGTYPAVLVQLLVLPVLVVMLEKAKAIPCRYPKELRS